MFLPHKPGGAMATKIKSQIEAAFDTFAAALRDKVNYHSDDKSVHLQNQRAYMKNIDKAYMELLTHYNGQPGKPIEHTLMFMAENIFFLAYGRNLIKEK